MPNELPQLDFATDRYRWLRAAEYNVSENYAKALLTLSGGGLALSLGFVDHIVKGPLVPGTGCLLALAWSAFAFSIVLVLANMLISQKALRLAMQGTGDVSQDARSFFLGGVVWTCNLGAGTTFVAGVLLLAFFAMNNLPQQIVAVESGAVASRHALSTPQSTPAPTPTSSPAESPGYYQPPPWQPSPGLPPT